uniref:Strain CBS138 chromosome J complete sequence n=1 Tax=Solanum tuberosum TaxID=4113 RepID=M1CMK5_SOLTU
MGQPGNSTQPGPGRSTQPASSSQPTSSSQPQSSRQPTGYSQPPSSRQPTSFSQPPSSGQSVGSIQPPTWRPSQHVSSCQQSTSICDDTSIVRRVQQAGRGRGKGMGRGGDDTSTVTGGQKTGRGRGRKGASTSTGGNKRPKTVGFGIYTDDISGRQTLNNFLREKRREEKQKVKNIEDDSQKMELVNWSCCYTRRNRRYYCRRQFYLYPKCRISEKDLFARFFDPNSIGREERV